VTAPGTPASTLECTVCASGVTSPHGVTAPGETAAATPGQAASLRAELEAAVRIWREESQPYPEEDPADAARRGGFGYCADELAHILDQHPEAQPAPELAAGAKPSLGTAWRLLNDLREQLAAITTEMHAAADANGNDLAAAVHGWASRIRQATGPEPS
jgi:hypothetical protein